MTRFFIGPKNKTYQESVRCEICKLVILRSSAVAMKGCRHLFCKKCITEHIMRNHDCFGQVQCPHGYCSNMLQPDEIYKYLGENGCDKFELSVVQLNKRQEHSDILKLQEKFNNYELEGSLVIVRPDESILAGGKNLEKDVRKQSPKLTDKPQLFNPEPKCNADMQSDQAFQTPLYAEQNVTGDYATNQQIVGFEERREKLVEEEKCRREDTETQQYIQNLIVSKEAMQCPKCGILVMKDDGCYFVTCAACGLGTCFITQKPRHQFISEDGQIIDGCHCMENDIKCHPQCTNCH